MWIPRIAGPARRLVGVAALVGLLLSGLVLTTGPRAAGAPDGARALVIATIPFAAIPAVFVARSQLFSLALFPLLLVLLRSEARLPSRRI